jgi:asparagine synthase (glutamine-hydrolysing)
MSGICGIVQLDQAPVDRQLLQRLSDSMSSRGPDAQEIWLAGPVGLGHALLRIAPQSRRERQPCTLDGQVWITADVRLDGRAALIELLGSESQERESDLALLPDAELILHAYRAWGEACVDNLLGDFAFAIWDEGRRQLFCARDHFGVKPFFYTQLDGALVFSNTLDCVRRHPAVSRKLNDLAIADFLLFGFNQDPATSVFTDIQRLPPAQRLTLRDGKVRLERYWTLPLDGRIRYPHAQDYVENFKEIFRVAVADRLPTDSAGVLMSGGMDSSSVAATAAEVLGQRSNHPDLRAYTVVFDRLIPDRERYYSKLVAEAVGIPIHYLAADDYRLYERWDRPELRSPEPDHRPMRAYEIDHLRQVASQSRVALSGLGGDPALYCSRSYLLAMMKKFQFRSLAAELGSYVLSRRRIPGFGIRTRMKRWLQGGSGWPYPGWFNRAFENRLDLPNRWRRFTQKTGSTHPTHPTRTEAYCRLLLRVWAAEFEKYDPGVTNLQMEVRHPFFDLRLLNYLLALPPLPSFDDKHLLREAMRGKLPEAVRLRPKTVLAGDPIWELRGSNSAGLRPMSPAPELDQYVDRETVRPDLGRNRLELLVNLRPLSLNLWLRQLDAFQYS